MIRGASTSDLLCLAWHHQLKRRYAGSLVRSGRHVIEREGGKERGASCYVHVVVVNGTPPGGFAQIVGYRCV